MRIQISPSNNATGLPGQEWGREMAWLGKQKTTIKRKGVHLALSEVAGEHRLLEGNRILSRHATEEEAIKAFRAEQASRVGRHTVPASE